MNSSTTPQQSTKSCHNDKLTYSLLLCQQHRPAGLGSFDAQSLSLLPIFLRLTFPIALAGSRSLPAVWLIPYRMGFPPIKCFTLSWTHWHAPTTYFEVGASCSIALQGKAKTGYPRVSRGSFLSGYRFFYVPLRTFFIYWRIDSISMNTLFLLHYNIFVL